MLQNLASGKVDAENQANRSGDPTRTTMEGREFVVDDQSS